MLARLGAFIFAALIIFGAGIFLIGQKEFLFSDTIRLYSPFDNVGGLANGAEVRVGGVHVGTVDHVAVPREPGAKVVVVMDLKSSTRNVIRKDSVASILTEGLLGNKYVSISFGSKNAEPVQDGDKIGSEPPIDLSDLIREAKVTLDNVEMATDHLKSISSKIDQGEGTIGGLVNDKSIYEDTKKTVRQAKIGVVAFQEDMEALKKNWFFRGFFHSRGYLDSSELTKNEISSLPEQPPVKKFIYHSKDLFDGSTTANLKDGKPLNQAGEFLQKTPFHLVAVTAYTGFHGDKEKNLELSRAQAMVARQYLVQHFKIDDNRVKTKGFGEDAETENDQDSRLEIIVYQ